jgi:hypothetical protein
MAITTTSVELTTPAALLTNADRPWKNFGYANGGTMLITSGLTLYLNHAYAWLPGAASTIVKIDKTVDLSTYMTGIWTGDESLPISSTSFTGDGSTTFTSLSQGPIWIFNDQGYPVTSYAVGKLGYLTTGNHVGWQATVTDLGTAAIAGQIEAFDSVLNLVLVDFSKKATP